MSAVPKVKIKLDRPKRVYRQGETINGYVLVESRYQLKHCGVELTMDGSVEMNTNLKAINLIDTFSSSTKVIKIVDFTHELLSSGCMSPGETRIPFSMLIDTSVDTTTLYETYHGVFISIQYTLKCRIKRSFFQRDFIETVEFFIEYADNSDQNVRIVEGRGEAAPPPAEWSLAMPITNLTATRLIKEPFKFEITPDSLSAAATATRATRRELIPDFRLTGQFDSLVWPLSEPITGEFVIEHCDAVIRSVELQLARIETCGLVADPSDGLVAFMSNDSLQQDQHQKRLQMDGQVANSRDSTEVQNIQVGDGDLQRNVPITIYMVLPRVFTCPTLSTNHFRIEFELNLIIIFDDNYSITENFPIKLVRNKPWADVHPNK